MNRLLRGLTLCGIVLGLTHADQILSFREEQLKQQLLTFHQSDGTSHFGERCLERYITNGGTLQFAKDISQVRDITGKNVFEEVSICFYYNNGGTIAYAESLAALTKEDNTPLLTGEDIYHLNNAKVPKEYVARIVEIKQGDKSFVSPRSIPHYYKSGIDFSTLSSLAKLQRLDGSFVFEDNTALHYYQAGFPIDFAQEAVSIKKSDGTSALDDFHIILLAQNNVNLSDAKKLIEIYDKEGNSVFTPHAYVNYRNLGGTVEEALEFLRIRDDSGFPLLDGYEIANLKEIGCSISTAESIASLRNFSGKQIFSGKGISWLFDTYNTVPVDVIYKVRKISSLKNHRNEPLFTEDDIVSYLYLNGTIKYAVELSKIHGLNGESLFDGQSIVKAFEWKMPISYAREMVSFKGQYPELEGDRIIRFYQLEMTAADLFFEDTEKPNAVIIYPTADHYDPTFEGDSNIVSFQELRNHYDTFTCIAAQEQEVYDALAHVYYVDLFSLSGHGIPTALSLGEKDLALEERTKDETYTIDTTDTELSYYFSFLTTDAIIVENSCSNAAQEVEENLATFIEEMSFGRTIIAATDGVDPAFDEVISFNPFDIKFYDNERGKIIDVTYKSKN